MIGPAQYGFEPGRIYLPPGVAGGFFASTPNGVVVKSRFGWADQSTGQISNTYSGDPSTILGIPLVDNDRLLRNSWQIATFDPDACLWTVRGGIQCGLAIKGDFWMPLPNGGSPGDRVYAKQTDGTPSTAAGVGYTVTPWRVMTYASCGMKALISSWFNPFGG